MSAMGFSRGHYNGFAHEYKIRISAGALYMHMVVFSKRKTDWYFYLGM